jgi:hypothetical protein
VLSRPAEVEHFPGRRTSIADVAREAIERQLPPERADEYVAKAIRKQRKR